MDTHISNFTLEYYANLKKDKLPFELSKEHKWRKRSKWKEYGIIFDGLFDEIYDIYIHSSECEKCKKKFKNSIDRQLDHDHSINDAFNIRGIICRFCNLSKKRQYINTNTGYKHITKIKDIKHYKQGFSYNITFYLNNNKRKDFKRITLEKAIECRDNFIKENPQYFD